MSPLFQKNGTCSPSVGLTDKRLVGIVLIQTWSSWCLSIMLISVFGLLNDVH